MTSPAISRDQVLHVARLARLDLDDLDIDRMTQELGAILRYVEILSEVDTSSVEPTAQVGVSRLPLREDVLTDGLPRDVVLAEAPCTSHDGFAVPAFIDE